MPIEAKRGQQSPRTGVIGGCELLDMGSRK